MPKIPLRFLLYLPLGVLVLLMASAVSYLQAQAPSQAPAPSQTAPAPSQAPAQGRQAPAPPNMANPQGTNPGIYSYSEKCLVCHDTGKDGAQDRYTLNQRFTPEEILASMKTGSMAKHAEGLTEFQKAVIAVYLGGRPLGATDTGDMSKMQNACATHPPLQPSKDKDWNGWGVDPGNSRYQPSPGLTAAQTPNLKLKWAFGFPMGNSAYSQPAVVGGRVFVGADTGFVYSLEAATGCIHWSFKADAGVRTSVAIGPGNAAHPFLAYFGDVKGNVYAVNADTGKQVWRDRTDAHPIARVVGSPTLAAGRLYVPVASLEESGGGNPKYPCCSFRGILISYDAVSGKRIWKSYTVNEAPKPLRVTSVGTQLWGPAGAAIWSSPSVDLQRKAVYVATGNGYTYPAVDTSNAVMAFDLDTGKRLWAKQAFPFDAYVRDCPGKYRPNVPTANKSETCPEVLGPDVDFGNAPIVRKAPDGRGLLVIGQKDGHGWAFDADKKGAIVWSPMLGLGIDNGGGGMQWGSAADDRFGYFPVTRGGPGLGLAAVDLKTGEIAWRATPPVGGGAPSSVMPGVVFQGTGAGMVYAYSTTDGKAIWEFNTAKEFETVNGVKAKGGNINAAGPAVAGGMLFVPSGYSDLGGGNRGNVLLAFGVD